MKKEKSSNDICYFAAANGYGGFRSYFGKVFNSSDYKRIFVLKGGPGTGKSSLMREIRNALISAGCSTEAILCSSDPASLDGVIAHGMGGDAAILDGTAPHERDAVIPGAIDEIVNLGDHWDEGWLISRREQILELCREKSRAYAAAYSYLRNAGFAAQEARRLTLAGDSEQNAKKLVKHVAEKYSGNSGKSDVRLISSFGKHGEYRLDTVERMSEELFGIRGGKYSRSAFMRSLADELSGRTDMMLCPNALLYDEYDAVFLKDGAVGFVNESIGDIIDVVDDCITLADSERAKALERIEGDAKREAQGWFSIASDMHFRLEDIYTQAMNFDAYSELSEKISHKMLNVIKS